MENKRIINFNIPAGQRLLLLLFTYLLGMIITAFLATFLLKIGGNDRHLAMMRISTVLQDIVMLVLPALATAVLVTRTPARLLALEIRPRPTMVLAAILVLVVSSPLMTAIIKWNDAITFPPALASLERSLRGMEAAAASSVTEMLGPHSVSNLLMSILIVGVLAGFCEELFFRGALQRLILSARVNTGIAVWCSAVIFSAVHFQFFGFVPRLLLGAYFGYLLVWSGSVWLPMLAHIFNNVMFVILSYVTGTGDPEIAGEGMATWIVPVLSAVLTVTGLILLYNMRINKPTE